MKNPRQIAAAALLEAESRAAWSNISLDSALRRRELSPADTAFVATLFYGVIERRLTLDACIRAHSNQRLEKLSAKVLCALRLGVYQLLYTDIPDHAALSESVEIARALKVPYAAGFVNGVLRAFLRSGKEVPLPGEPLAARLSIEFSCPQPLVDILLASAGEKSARAFLADSLGRPPISVRVNTQRTDASALIKLLADEGVQASPHSQLPDCLMLESTGAVAALRSFQLGLFHVQDVSSQLCVSALGPQPGMRVLDACAAPGGKTFTAAQLMGGRGEIVACDLHEQRVGLITKRAEQMGLAGITAIRRDMSVHHEDLGFFDRVLCDMPCSGYGVIRRKPEIKYKPLSEFEKISILQYNILEKSAQYCKEGGVLIYSTCTFNPQENEQVVGRFLERHPQFTPRPLGGLLGEHSSRTLLGDFGGDGFFLAGLQKVGSA